MENIYTIYKATNKTNGNKYIGFDSRSPTRQYRHKWYAKNKPEQYFQRAIKKYGEDIFEWEVIYQSKDMEHTLQMEEQLIREYNTIRPNGYNVSSGGDRSLTTGTHCSEETKRKISNANKGRKWSKEACEIRSKKYSGKGNPFYGKHHLVGPSLGKLHSEESKQKMSATKKGKKFNNPMANPIHRDKISSVAKSRYKIVRDNGTWYWGHKENNNNSQGVT